MAAPVPATVSSMGLQSLQGEPQVLLDRAERLNNQLERLVMDNYHVFIQNITCSSIVSDQSDALARVIAEMRKNLAGLAEDVSKFRDRSQQLSMEYNRNRKTLQHHMQIVELLEVPQLMDTCVRNGLYAEALELGAFVNSLEKRHLLSTHHGAAEGSSSNQIINSIVQESAAHLADLRKRLVRLLCDNVTLPQALDIVANLRKVDSIAFDRTYSKILRSHAKAQLTKESPRVGGVTGDEKMRQLREEMQALAETKLQVDFLEARDLYLERELSGIRKLDFSGGSHTVEVTPTNAYAQAIDLLEMSRIHWFEITSQFKALFTGKGAQDPSILLSAWLSRRINRLLRDIEQLLPHMDDGDWIRGVLEQSLFLAKRMAPLGGDFSGLVLPTFVQAIMSTIQKEWSQALRDFDVLLQTDRIPLRDDQQAGAENLSLVVPLCSPIAPDSSALPATPSGSNEVRPPSKLLAFPPVAMLVNAVLTGLNRVRACPIKSMCPLVESELSALVIGCCTVVVERRAKVNERTAQYLGSGSAASSSAELAASLAQTVYEVAIHHLMECFHAIYPVSPQWQSTLPDAKEKCRQMFVDAGLLPRPTVSQGSTIPAPAHANGVSSPTTISTENDSSPHANGSVSHLPAADATAAAADAAAASSDLETDS